MKIVFRTDASLQIGTGHVMRCLTLADALKADGAECHFICREHPGNLIEYIRLRGFVVFVLLDETSFSPIHSPREELAAKETSSPESRDVDWETDALQTKVGVSGTVADWLIVDHYALDVRWESSLRSTCRRLMVIDDLADRQHDCDLLLDQNYYCNQDQRYKGLLPEHCVTILGPKYVLLRPEFDAARQQLKVRGGTIKRILIFFGGSDPTNQTETALKALERLSSPGILVDVVVGSTNPNRHSIQSLCNLTSYANYYCNISNMAELIANADLGIGAGGSAMWERCYLGLPTITVVFADNQVSTTEDVAGLGAIKYLGWSHSLGIEDYQCAISDAIANPHLMKQISEAALRVLNERTTTAVNEAMRDLLQPFSARISIDSPKT